MTSMPSHQTSQPRPQAPMVGFSQSSSTKRMSCRAGVDADGAEAVEQQGLAVDGGRFQQHLILVVVLQAVGVFAVAAVGGAAAGLHVGGAPGARARVRAGWWRDAACRRRSRCRRVAGWRSPGRPRTGAGSGSGPGTTGCRACGLWPDARVIVSGSVARHHTDGRGCCQETVIQRLRLWMPVAGATPLAFSHTFGVAKARRRCQAS